MKFFLAFSLAVLTTGAFAADDLNTMKSQANSKIDREMTNLRNAQSCIKGASTVDAFKACNFTGGEMQREEEVIKSKTIQKQDKGLDEKVKDKYDETKKDIDDAM